MLFSGEGTLSAFDIRKHKLLLQSELLDSALLSVAIVKVNGLACRLLSSHAVFEVTMMSRMAYEVSVTCASVTEQDNFALAKGQSVMFCG